MKSMEKIISRRGAETRSNWNAIVASTVDALINTLGLFLYAKSSIICVSASLRENTSFLR